MKTLTVYGAFGKQTIDAASVAFGHVADSSLLKGAFDSASEMLETAETRGHKIGSYVSTNLGSFYIAA